MEDLSGERRQELLRLRVAINAHDREITDRLRARVALTTEVARLKRSWGRVMLDSTREAEILDRVAGGGDEHENALIRNIYGILFDYSKQQWDACLEPGPNNVGTR